MTLLPSSRIRQNPRTAWRGIDEQALLVAIDARQLHRMNGVAARIWELADGRSVDEVAEVIHREYAVERTVALADTHAFVERLQALGVIHIENGD